MERYQPDQYGRMMPDAHGQWVSLRAAELTALDAAQKSSADAQATIAALQAQLKGRTAELERVREELAETSLYLQQERANRDSLAACVDRDVKTIKELRALILALPKVEGGNTRRQNC